MENQVQDNTTAATTTRTTMVSKDFKKFDYPITFKFNIGTLANDFTAKDNSGKTVAYVKQKLFKLKEAITVYADESKQEVLYTINADRIIDFNASYYFSDKNGDLIGKIGRKGMRSLWKASYEIFDKENNCEFTVKEENPMAKVFDAVAGEIPIVGMFTGLMFHPKYGVLNAKGETVARLSKQSSFFGRIFLLEKLEGIENNKDEKLMLALMMMSLLERRRG